LLLWQVLLLSATFLLFDESGQYRSHLVSSLCSFKDKLA